MSDPVYPTTHLVFGPDGRRLFCLEEGAVTAWDVAASKPVCRASGRWLGIDGRGRTLLTLDAGDRARAWDVPSGAAADPGTVSPGDFESYQRMRVVAGPRQVMLEDVFDGETRREIPLPDQYQSWFGIQRDPLAPYAALIVGYDLGGFEGEYGICLDLETACVAGFGFKVAPNDGKRQIAFCAGQKAAAINNDYRGAFYRADVHDVSSGEHLGTIRQPNQWVSINPQDRTQLALATGPDLHLVDVTGGQARRAVSGKHDIQEIAFHPGGERAACIHADGRIRVWGLGSGTLEAEFEVKAGRG